MLKNETHCNMLPALKLAIQLYGLIQYLDTSDQYYAAYMCKMMWALD